MRTLVLTLLMAATPLLAAPVIRVTSGSSTLGYESTVDFGCTRVTSRTDTRAIRIYNDGNQTLSVNNITITQITGNRFTTNWACCAPPFTIAPGASKSFTISLPRSVTDQSDGSDKGTTYKARIRIFHNATNETNPFSFVVTGTNRCRYLKAFSISKPPASGWFCSYDSLFSRYQQLRNQGYLVTMTTTNCSFGRKQGTEDRGESDNLLPEELVQQLDELRAALDFSLEEGIHPIEMGLDDQRLLENLQFLQDLQVQGYELEESYRLLLQDLGMEAELDARLENLEK